MAKQCPDCGMTNPDSGMHCDCGFSFPAQKTLADAPRSKDRRRGDMPLGPPRQAVVGNGQAELDLLARAVATMACVAGYTVLWSLGFAAGFLLPIWVLVVAAVVLQQILSTVGGGEEGTTSNRILIDVTSPVIVGVIPKLLLNLVPATPTWALGIVGIVLCGGTGFGLLRRRILFVRFFTHPFVKVIGVIGVVLMAVTVVFGSLVVLAGVGSGMAVPVELITPSVVPKGWTPTKPVSHTGRKWISYHKGRSRVQVSGEPGRVIDEEARAIHEETGHVVLSGIGPMTELDHSDFVTADGVRRHTRHYRFVAAERVELVEHYFYCGELETSVCAFASVMGEPFDELLREAREMLDSLRCVGPTYEKLSQTREGDSIPLLQPAH